MKQDTSLVKGNQGGRRKKLIKRISSILVMIMFLQPLLLTVGLIQAAATSANSSLKLDNFSTATQVLQLNGNAIIKDNYLQLTPAKGHQKGSAFTKSKVSLPSDYTFSSDFTFSISDPGAQEWVKSAIPSQYWGGDGIRFVLQPTSQSALNYGDYSKALEIVFQTYSGNADQNHIVFRENGRDIVVVPNTDLSQWNFKDGANYRVWVDYDGTVGSLKLYMSRNSATKPSTPVLSRSMNLATVLGTSEVYAGFASHTGQAFEEHKILSWNLQAGRAATKMVRIEAEQGELLGSAKIESAFPGASQGKHVAFINREGNGVKLGNLPAASSFMLRYAALVGGKITLKVSDPVGNEKSNSKLSFSSTSSWGTHQQMKVDANISEGDSVTFQYEPGDAAINIDFIQFGDSQPPVPKDHKVTVLDDQPLTFKATDFQTEDNENNPVVKIRVESLPSSSRLTLSSNDLVAGQEIANTALGNIGYIPASSSGTEQFTWKAFDGLTWSTVAATMTIRNGVTDEEAVEENKQRVEIGYGSGDNSSNVTQHLALSTTGTLGATISWTSSREDIISPSGIINPSSAGDVNVTLTATIQKGTKEDTKAFTVTVKRAVAPVLEYQRVGPTKISSVAPFKYLNIVGKGFSSVSTDFHRYSLVHAVTKQMVPIPVASIKQISDSQLQVILPENLEKGSYDLILGYKTLTLKTYKQAFEVTDDPRYVPRHFSEVEFDSSDPTAEVQKLVFKGPFTEDNQVYRLHDPNQVVTINSYVMFKGSSLTIDKKFGVVTGDGRLYVNGRSKNGVTTTYTLHNGSFQVKGDDFRILLSSNTTYDYLNMRMPIGVDSIYFTDNGLRVKGSILPDMDISGGKVTGKANIDSLYFTNSGVDLKADFELGSKVKLGALEAPGVRVGIDTKNSFYSFGASAEIKNLGRGFEMELAIIQGMLDTVKFAVSTEIKIGNTGAQITKLGGGIKNMSRGSQAPLTLLATGGLSDYVTPKINDKYALNADPIDLGLSKSHVELKGSLAVYTINVAELEMKAVFYPVGYPGYNKPGFQMDAKVDILSILIGKLHVSYYKGDSFLGYAMVKVVIPSRIPMIGGLTLSSASLGVDDKRVKGTLSVIGIGFVATYVFQNKDVDIDVKLGALATAAAKLVTGAVTATAKAVSAVTKTVTKAVSKAVTSAAKSVVTVISKPIKTVTKAVSSVKSFFKKWFTGPILLASTEIDPTQLEQASLMEIEEDMVGVELTVSDDQKSRALIEVNGANPTMKVYSREGEIDLHFNEDNPQWNAIYREEERKVFVVLDLTENDYFVGAADGSIQSDDQIHVYTLGGESMQQVVDEVLKQKVETTFNVTEEASILIEVQYARSDMKLYQPNGEEYELVFDRTQEYWNAIDSPEDQKLYLRITVQGDQLGEWKLVSPKESGHDPQVDFYDLDEGVTMEHILRGDQAIAFGSDSYQAYVRLANATPDTKIFNTEGKPYKLVYDDQATNWNAYFDEASSTLHLLLNDVQGDWAVRGSDQSLEPTVYALTPEQTSLHSILQAVGPMTTFYHLTESQRVLFDMGGANPSTKIIRPDGTIVEYEFDGENPNALYRGDQNRLYVNVDVNQMGEWAVESEGAVQVYLSKVLPITKIQRFDVVTVNDRTVRMDWSITDPQPDSKVKVMLTTDPTQLAGPTLWDNLDLEGSQEFVLPPGFMNGQYWLVMAVHSEELGTMFKTSPTPIHLISSDAPPAPQDLHLISYGNGEIKLGFTGSTDSGVTGYRVLHADENGKVDYFGSNYEVESSEAEAQQVVISGLPTNQKYFFRAMALKETRNGEDVTGTVSELSNLVEVMLPEPNHPKLGLEVVPQGTGRVIHQYRMAYYGEQEKETYMNSRSALFKITSDQAVTFDVYLNGQLYQTFQGEEASFTLEDLEDRDYFLDIRATNEQGDFSRYFQTLYVDTQAPFLQIDSPLFGEVMNTRMVTVTGKSEVGTDLTIEGQKVTVEEDGSFVHTYPFPLMEENPYLEINVQDAVGNRVEHHLELTRGLVLDQEVKVEKGLKSLSVNYGEIQPAFASERTAYHATVPYEVEELTVAAAVMEQGAQLNINGEVLASGQGSQTVPLQVGVNEITFVVFNEGVSNTKTYLLTVTRSPQLSSDATLMALTANQGTLNPLFDPAIYEYRMTVSNSVHTIKMTARAKDENATMELNQQPLQSGEERAVRLNEGENTVTITVIAQDRVSMKQYILTIYRERSSSSSSDSITTSKPSAPTVSGKIGNKDTSLEAKMDEKNQSIAITNESMLTAVGALRPAETLTIRASDVNQWAKLHIGLNALRQLAEKKGHLQVDFGNAFIELPPSWIPLDQSVAGNSQLSIERVELSADELVQAESLAEAASGKRVGTPVGFHITIDGNQPDSSHHFIKASIPLPKDEGYDPNRMAAVLIKDGRLIPLPVAFKEDNGQLTALVHSTQVGAMMLLERGETFEDIVHHWAQKDIELLANRMMVSGTGEESFSPNREISRAEFATLLVTTLGIQPSGKSREFTDVQSGDWYASAVQTAVQAGLFSGVNDYSFAPNQPITREQMAIVFMNAIEKYEMALPVNQAKEPLRDMENISGWARAGVVQAIEAGLMQGDQHNRLNPASIATRAEAASVLVRMLKKSSLF